MSELIRACVKTSSYSDCE